MWSCGYRSRLSVGTDSRQMVCFPEVVGVNCGGLFGGIEAGICEHGRFFLGEAGPLREITFGSCVRESGAGVTVAFAILRLGVRIGITFDSKSFAFSEISWALDRGPTLEG